MRTKFDTANAIPEGTYSKRWVAHNILGLSDEEFLRNQRESFYDRKYQQSLESLAEQSTEDLLGDEGLGGDLGGELGGDLEGDLEGELGGEEAPPEGEDSALLAAPARREDITEKDDLRQYAKSSYRTVQKRGGDQRRQHRSGPTKRNIRNSALPEAPRLATDRAKTPGRVTAADLGMGKIDFKSLVGLEEQKQSIYNNSEVVLIENTMKVRELVEQLEQKEDKEAQKK